jgi:hypothetical protein
MSASSDTYDCEACTYTQSIRRPTCEMVYLQFFFLIISVHIYLSIKCSVIRLIHILMVKAMH